MRRPDRTPQQRRTRRRRRGLILLVLLALLAIPTTSFIQAMTYPGSAPASVRVVEWVRDHGGGAIVDRIELWQYTRNAPAATGPPNGELSPPPKGTPTTTGTGTPEPITTLARALPGEGQWEVARRTPSGEIAMSMTWFRADPAHLPVSVAAVHLNQAVTALHLGAGTREPLPGYTPTGDAQVPAAERSTLLAVFNAGFKMNDTHGGWFADGHAALPPRDGLASVVIDRTGHATIGAWGSDVTMTPDVTAVRQNLHLIVRDAAPVPGLASNSGGLFGTAKNQFQYTWRSGLGMTRHGDLVYVAGQGLTLQTLASALVRAGAVTALELDMHPHQVAFNYFRTAQDAVGGHGTNLLPAMRTPPDRYLVPDQRDFFYVSLR